ncbi:MAG: hypothetical protein ACYSTO_09535 [Planctomycetota bacterium]
MTTSYHIFALYLVYFELRILSSDPAFVFLTKVLLKPQQEFCHSVVACLNIEHFILSKKQMTQIWNDDKLRYNAHRLHFGI